MGKKNKKILNQNESKFGQKKDDQNLYLVPVMILKKDLLKSLILAGLILAVLLIIWYGGWV